MVSEVVEDDAGGRLDGVFAVLADGADGDRGLGDGLAAGKDEDCEVEVAPSVGSGGQTPTE